MKLKKEEVLSLVGIGFCQPKFYKPSVWRKAKRLMDTIVCPNNLAYPHDFGRGKGKYNTELSIEDVKQKTIGLLRNSGQLIEGDCK